MSDWLYPDAVVETEWLEARLEDESVAHSCVLRKGAGESST